MTEKHKFGHPIIETGAVIADIPVSQDTIRVGKIKSQWPFIFEYAMEKNDKVFGLGENVRGINKRGFKYVSWCSDIPGGCETDSSLYGSHNFIVIYGKEITGLFFDNPSKVEFDIGWSDYDTLSVKCDMDGLFVYVITSHKTNRKDKLYDIIRQFRTMIGHSYIPPLWGLGYQQSRWGYKSEADIRDVVKQYKDKGLPLDSVCLDIDYMDQYMDFTVDTTRFSDFSKLNSDLKKENIHLIPIIDAGVKVKQGYSVYDEGVQNDYFCKKSDGSIFTAGVWPGRSNFTDFFIKEARDWFGSKYKTLTDQGVEGFWNDMNEPALFYSDDGLKEVFDKVKEYEGKNLDVNSFFTFTGLVREVANKKEDYESFYHTVKNLEGQTVTVRHDHVHNLYGALMTKAAGDSLKEIRKGRRTLLYSRASAIGSHRDAGIWMGDNRSHWSNIELELKMLPSLNMCGYLYTGADIGGFGDNTSRDLLLRWLSLGVFTPLMRNHTSCNTRNQECYAFGKTQDFKSILSLRYALIPYIYSEYVKAAVKGEMMFKPLAFEYPEDKIACDTEDELIIGNEILIAPVYKQNARGRNIYLPQDMIQVTWKDSLPYQSPVEKGLHYIEVPEDTVVFFIRSDKCIPICSRIASCTQEIDYESITKLGNSSSSYDLYQDDGYTTDIRLEEHIRQI